MDHPKIRKEIKKHREKTANMGDDKTLTDQNRKDTTPPEEISKKVRKDKEKAVRNPKGKSNIRILKK